ncbi:uncharacterized protein FIESC28_02106 [Fusarium coffeatum]|uniref:Uncharacterized protein n=1 Tax=Fusarium coffeatum TaxID=231269 RepID=A0A366S8G5_9HYPO|nr:uncharacterized protein FIESC28_02106 [Fusarium coffeatum]RBR25198.1 hypothetical protein FIESC28_02106 [Fusarium coffeatum]
MMWFSIVSTLCKKVSDGEATLAPSITRLEPIVPDELEIRPDPQLRPNVSSKIQMRWTIPTMMEIDIDNSPFVFLFRPEQDIRLRQSATGPRVANSDLICPYQPRRHQDPMVELHMTPFAAACSHLYSLIATDEFDPSWVLRSFRSHLRLPASNVDGAFLGVRSRCKVKNTARHPEAIQLRNRSLTVPYYTIYDSEDDTHDDQAVQENGNEYGNFASEASSVDLYKKAFRKGVQKMDRRIDDRGRPNAILTSFMATPQ